MEGIQVIQRIIVIAPPAADHHIILIIISLCLKQGKITHGIQFHLTAQLLGDHLLDIFPLRLILNSIPAGKQVQCNITDRCGHAQFIQTFLEQCLQLGRIAAILLIFCLCRLLYLVAPGLSVKGDRRSHISVSGFVSAIDRFHHFIPVNTVRNRFPDLYILHQS